MAANLQFSIAVHALVGLRYRCELETTSEMIASSVNTSPSFVRRVLAKLSKAGLIETTKGKHGHSRLARDASLISLWDVYQAVDAPKAFAIHQYEVSEPCQVSCQIKQTLEMVLGESQTALAGCLEKISIEDLVKNVSHT
ncbi:Rrf2 family protein [Haloferula luteola]|uniref:Rrf2 family protein n=1 Tax=Haloferula luteola TaxID=595692 RepID=A0A840V578_9BACT|nr:Rrf2 family transcriptional regulator [Haloferula luteola]MBB5352763.1 Rrf2 family protein [Haloferula luteola]